MKQRWLVLGLALLTLACVPGGDLAPKGAAGGPASDALASEAISVETLAPAGAQGAGVAVAADLAGDLAAKVPKPRPEGLAEAAPLDPVLTEAPEEELVAEPEPKPPASPEEAACVRKGGLWINAGKSIAMACVKVTKDAGKQCRREQDCQGQCLARSMTCAPYDPLFGCNEVLQNDGSRVTLCLD